MYNIAGMTLNGMYHYFNDLKEEPLFENIVLYSGGIEFEQEIPAIDSGALIFTIMEQSGELLPYRQIPDRFKQAVEIFFKSYYESFRKLWIALMMDYNPIENYDRKEKWKDTYNSDQKRTDSTNYRDTDDIEYTGTETDTLVKTGSETNSNVQTGNTVTTNELSADNGGWQNDTKSTVEPPTKTDDTLTFTDRQDTNTKGFNSRKDNRTMEHTYLNGNDLNEHRGYDEREGRAHGNIGVTTSQQMALSSLEIGNINFYTYVADLFEKELLMQLY